MWLPWLLLILVSGLFWTLQQQWQRHPETAVVQHQQPLLQQRAGGVVSYHEAVLVAAPAVVNIYTLQTVNAHSHIDDPALRKFFEFHGGQLPNQPDHDDDGTSLGSGVVVRADGYILTNNHVVAKADRITVAFQDGKRAKATVIGTDPDSDLAVIKVERQGLPVLPFKKTMSQVGDVVLAIGNPFGVGQTVTQGIISATGRTGLGINTYEDFIQTDAAINPGNSGGALIDVAGNLVGINTAIFSRSGGSMGIGFAIPVTLAQQVMNDIIQYGKVTRGWLGIEVGSDTDPTQATADQAGVVVAGVMKNGPASLAGLRLGDRILAIDGTVIADAAQLITEVARKKPDSRVELRIKRGQADLLQSIQISERPSSSDENAVDSLER
jgi:serine protease DegS